MFNPYVLEVLEGFDVDVVESLGRQLAISERVEPEFGNFLREFGTGLEDGLLEGDFVYVYREGRK